MAAGSTNRAVVHGTYPEAGVTGGTRSVLEVYAGGGRPRKHLVRHGMLYAALLIGMTVGLSTVGGLLIDAQGRGSRVTSVLIVFSAAAIAAFGYLGKFSSSVGAEAGNAQR
jgi:hypothetical protein